MFSDFLGQDSTKDPQMYDLYTFRKKCGALLSLNFIYKNQMRGFSELKSSRIQLMFLLVMGYKYQEKKDDLDSVIESMIAWSVYMTHDDKNDTRIARETIAAYRKNDDINMLSVSLFMIKHLPVINEAHFIWQILVKMDEMKCCDVINKMYVESSKNGMITQESAGRLVLSPHSLLTDVIHNKTHTSSSWVSVFYSQ